MTSDEHRELVSLIRGVHNKLRKSLSISGDPDKVWDEHLNEKDLRKQYSLAMWKLATQVWNKNEKDCRIKWTYRTCILTDTNEYLDRKLQLLDVGSCYNPFSKFPQFSCVAIDLTPATEDVIECDFLTVDILEKPTGENSTISYKPCFHAESFDIVVFSLVLEYVPAPKQRAVFCVKAWKLLKQNGLFIIITPDSKSVHHNAPMMKSWKSALERIGFFRVKYDKLQHLHCMAFRKMQSSQIYDSSFYDSISELLYIPQDFIVYSETKVVERTEAEDFDIYSGFLELPEENVF
ncbi:S-adenosylmethionine sensor upstream of mTORC1-like isoform X2 [Stegodyphus dumicola]|uniref:S-adenosylmethionine sensor upstream of mTORC1-like isoform X2 n=1 Tax=Stegodyphus dumicola TaxID=202533 RepID=UPI0015A85833|nr:S-adenosylmethionine sensor upstream of mTORC1-like isoform X2 [Stegodyphus dumicola]